MKPSDTAAPSCPAGEREDAAGLCGRVHSFQSMGAVDGPGLRFVVFLQGCPLRCAYCHNPDTWDPSGGQIYGVEDILARVRRCRPYIYEKGGVTVTGGEPLAQPAFTGGLFAALRREGYHTALDTAGAASLPAARGVLAHTSLVLADLKFITEDDYRRYTGGSLAHTLAFLSLTQEMGIPLWVRHVVVPGLTDSERHIRALARLAGRFSNLEKLELLGFRKLCLEKYEALGRPFPLAHVPEMEAASLASLQAAVWEELPGLAR